jgi:septum formation topological specificity factor MinE
MAIFGGIKTESTMVVDPDLLARTAIRAKQPRCKLLGRLEMLVKERRTATPERVKAIQREITAVIHEMLVIDANLN